MENKEENKMENRVKRFHDLHNNKWFHIMNHIIDIIRTSDKHQKYMLIKYGKDFYY
jgi:hypothetical protein